MSEKKPNKDQQNHKNPGPDPELLNLEGDWEDSVHDALQVPPPVTDEKDGKIKSEPDS